jgi:glycosyltransferase involved in cell wall biosynthesis
MSTPIRGWSDIVQAYQPALMQARTRPERRPKVSLCVVADRAEHQLQSTINSVLGQRFDDLEIVIVDNESSYVAAGFGAAPDDRVRVIRNETTVSQDAGFNVAVRHSRGQFVKLLYPEDLLQPDCIAAQAKVLEDDHSIALVAAQTDYIDRTGEVARRQPGFAQLVGANSGQRVVKAIVRGCGNPIGPPSAAMFRRADFQRCGGLRDDLREWSDLELWTRLLRFGEFFGIPKTLASVPARRSSMRVSASIPLQLAERIEFTRRLINDPVWRVSRTDRMVGYVKYCVSSLRVHRYGLPHQPLKNLKSLNAIHGRRSRRPAPGSAGPIGRTLLDRPLGGGPQTLKSIK